MGLDGSVQSFFFAMIRDGIHNSNDGTYIFHRVRGFCFFPRRGGTLYTILHDGKGRDDVRLFHGRTEQCLFFTAGRNSKYFVQRDGTVSRRDRTVS